MSQAIDQRTRENFKIFSALLCAFMAGQNITCIFFLYFHFRKSSLDHLGSTQQNPWTIHFVAELPHIH
jgi:hypothetical protein